MSRLWPRNKFISSRSSVITLIKSSSSWFIPASVRAGCRDAQTLLHDGTRGGVLQELPLFGVEVMLDGKSGERSLVKAAQDELLLARIGVDVADREDAGNAGLEFLRIHLERPLLELHAPVGDGTQFRMQPVKGENVLRGQCEISSVGRVHVEPRERVTVPA